MRVLVFVGVRTRITIALRRIWFAPTEKPHVPPAGYKRKFIMLWSDFTKRAAILLVPSLLNRRYARPSSPRVWTSLYPVAILLTAAPCFAEEPIGRTAAAQSLSVTIENSIFTPGEIAVTPGTSVTWTNNDAMPHTVVDVNKSFRSKTLVKGGTFMFTFTNVGDYNYFCSVHPNMKGKVMVKPAAD